MRPIRTWWNWVDPTLRLGAFCDMAHMQNLPSPKRHELIAFFPCGGTLCRSKQTLRQRFEVFGQFAGPDSDIKPAS